MHACPKCQSDRVINNGSAAGKPKKHCKQCGFQFTRIFRRGKPLSLKVNAALWYLSTMSINRIAQFLALCSRSKWSKHFTNSPFLALLAMDGSKAAHKIISACANAVS